MKKLILPIVFVGSALLTACATQTGWTPTVDYYGDPNAYRINQDIAECQQLARQAAGGTAGTAKESAIGMGIGGLIGAASGAALGAAIGDPGKGAAIGAAAGGIGGGTYQGYDAEQQYKRAYSNCLRGRGHRVVN